MAYRWHCLPPKDRWHKTIILHGSSSNRKVLSTYLWHSGNNPMTIFICAIFLQTNGVIYMYVICKHFKQFIDQLVMVANPARGQLNREKKKKSPRLHLRIWSREAHSLRPFRPVPARSFSLLRLDMVLIRGISPASLDDIHLHNMYRQPPSGQSRIHLVTQGHTDDVHCQESTGTGPPVILKVILVTGVAFFRLNQGPTLFASLCNTDILYSIEGV